MTHVTQAAPVAKQPAPGTVTRTTNAARVPKQPVNRNPHRGPSKPTTVVDKSDKGKKGAKVTKDRGKRNAAPTRDLGR